MPVYVGNLPNNIKRLKLVRLFKKYGNILSIRFRTNSGKRFMKKAQVKSAPFLIAFIYFETREAAEASVACNGTQIGDNVIHVDLDAEKRVEENHNPQSNTVVVGNLKYGMVHFDLLLFGFSNRIFCKPFLIYTHWFCGELQPLHMKFCKKHSNAVVKSTIFARCRG